MQPYVFEGDYLTYHHPFTEAGAAAARLSAGKICAGRKQAAVRTRGACSMEECTTHYQCVDEPKN